MISPSHQSVAFETSLLLILLSVAFGLPVLACRALRKEFGLLGALSKIILQRTAAILYSHIAIWLSFCRFIWKFIVMPLLRTGLSLLLSAGRAVVKSLVILWRILKFLAGHAWRALGILMGHLYYWAHSKCHDYKILLYWSTLKTVRTLRRLSSEPKSGMGLLGSAVFLLAAFFSVLHPPEAATTEEMAQLLAADTFIHGRLANPPHPLAAHFGAPLELQQPAYASTVPPGQALFLAIGQKLIGQPIVGVWLSFSLACLALYWMLRASFTPSLSLIGSSLGALFFGFLGEPFPGGPGGYWSQGYAGGSVAALGAALVFGALLRACSLPRRRDAWVLGAGFAVLSAGRPLEALVVGACAAFFVRGLLKAPSGPPRDDLRKALFWPCAISLSVLLAGAGYYHWRLTGNPFRPPSSLLGLDPNAPAGSAAQGILEKAGGFLSFYFGPGLLLALLPALRLWKDPARRCLLAAFALVPLTAMLLQKGPFFPHHAAACAPLAVFFLAFSIQTIWHSTPWLRAVGTTAVVFALLSAVPFSKSKVNPTVDPTIKLRAALGKELPEGRHLVLVRQLSGRDPRWNAVYNPADIDTAKVVWAREINDYDQTRRLFTHFVGRRIWLLDADKFPPEIVPYSGLPR